MSAAVLREAFLQLPALEQATLLDDLIISSCDATWEARIAHEMEERVDAVNRGDMALHSADSVFGEMTTVSKAPSEKQVWHRSYGGGRRCSASWAIGCAQGIERPLFAPFRGGCDANKPAIMS